MKKLMLSSLLVLGTLVSAQRLQDGEFQLNAGVALGSVTGIPVYAGLDYGLSDNVSIGGQVSYATESDKYAIYDYKETWFGISGNVNYHFNELLNIPNNWDLYGGGSLNYNSFSYDNDIAGFDGESSGVGIGGQIGGRYYFTDALGVNLEVGAGTVASGGKLGITFKF